MNPRSWYAIQSTDDRDTDESVEVSIYDEIGFGGVTAKQFSADLKKLKGQHIDLRINSVGGSVIEGAAIFNALKRHKGGLTVHIDGLAASMASVIAMAGEETRIAENALLMIHNPWSMTMGDAADLRKEADVLDKLKATLVNAYVRKTGQPRAAIEQMMDDEKWMDAQEALELGFVDEIDAPIAAAASVTPEQARARFAQFQNTMASKPAPEPAAPVDTVAEDNMNSELQAKVDALQADLDAKNAAEAVQAQAAEDLAKELETLKAEVERLAAESASKDEEIATLRAEQKSAGEQAAAIVASVGIDTAATPVVPELTAAQKFAALEGPEATQFFRANKAEILKTFYS
jgi:ATP-dependent Clp endopeptidase proteolytic subunit ClpP